MFIALIAAAACGGSPDRREYKLEGQVVALAPQLKQATIKHEDIPGLMSAMTMPYEVQDTNELEGLTPGDLITARLIVLPSAAYIEDVKKVGTAPLERAAADTGGATGGFELLKTGAPVPNVTLVDQDGKTVTLDTFRGSALVVTFIYTNCPMPEFCPLMDRNFAAIQKKLLEQRNELKTHLLSVSFDPAVDTPAVMKKHAAGLGADPNIWSFVTGDRDEIDKWAAGFGVSVARAMNDPANITHNLRTVILDRQGNLVQTYNGNEWTPEQVLADVRVMVGVD